MDLSGPAPTAVPSTQPHAQTVKLVVKDDSDTPDTPVNQIDLDPDDVEFADEDDEQVVDIRPLEILVPEMSDDDPPVPVLKLRQVLCSDSYHTAVAME